MHISEYPVRSNKAPGTQFFFGKTKKNPTQNSTEKNFSTVNSRDTMVLLSNTANPRTTHDQHTGHKKKSLSRINKRHTRLQGPVRETGSLESAQDNTTIMGVLVNAYAGVVEGSLDMAAISGAIRTFMDVLVSSCPRCTASACASWPKWLQPVVKGSAPTVRLLAAQRARTDCAPGMYSVIHSAYLASVGLHRLCHRHVLGGGFGYGLNQLRRRQSGRGSKGPAGN